MPRLLFTLTAISVLLHPADSMASFCTQWTPAKKLHNLNTKLIPEASGLTASRKFPGRLYWLNDSSNKDQLFYGPLAAADLTTVEMQGPRFRDTEALALAPCGDEDCLIVADTGNNYHRRKDAQLAIFKESALLTKTAEPFRRITIHYAEGPRDVEALTALPNGDLLLITKEVSLLASGKAEVYRLTQSDWLRSDAKDFTLEKKGELAVGTWLKTRRFLSDAVTDAAVNLKRDVLGLLTYSAVIEIPISKLEDLAHMTEWKAGQDYEVITIKNLTQQETLTYLHDSDTLIWSSESYPPRTPVFAISCARTTP